MIRIERGFLDELHRIPRSSENESNMLIEVFDSSGALLSKQVVGQEFITNAAWTADSKFFVFITEITGGHQPGHHPLGFFFRGDNKFRNIEDFGRGWVTDGFKIREPDFVRFKKDDGKGGEIEMEVQLSKLIRTKPKKPNHSHERTGAQ